MDGRPPHLDTVLHWLLTLSIWGWFLWKHRVYGLAPLNLLGDELMEALTLGPLIRAQVHWAPCPGLLESLKGNLKEPHPQLLPQWKADSGPGPGLTALEY